MVKAVKCSLVFATISRFLTRKLPADLGGGCEMVGLLL